jgi:hypothetical protein
MRFYHPQFWHFYLKAFLVNLYANKWIWMNLLPVIKDKRDHAKAKRMILSWKKLLRGWQSSHCNDVDAETQRWRLCVSDVLWDNKIKKCAKNGPPYERKRKSFMTLWEPHNERRLRKRSISCEILSGFTINFLLC